MHVFMFTLNRIMGARVRPKTGLPKQQVPFNSPSQKSSTICHAIMQLLTGMNPSTPKQGWHPETGSAGPEIGISKPPQFQASRAMHRLLFVDLLSLVDIGSTEFRETLSMS